MKQMLVVRRDLKMRRGKEAAQCAHASMKVLLDRKVSYGIDRGGSDPFDADARLDSQLVIDASDIDNEWLFGPEHKKVCVSVDSEEELLDCVTKAQEAGIPVAMITDQGRTEFGGVPTNTVAAIGPATDEDLEPITGHLRLR